MARTAAAFLCAAFLAATAGATFARPSAAVREYKRFGLFGTWAPDCREAASPDNPRVIVRLVEGNVSEQDEFGADYEVNRYLIVAARHMSGHRLAVDALFQQGEAEPHRQLIIMRVAGHTRRTLFTGTGEGEPLVKDGIALANGKPTPVLNKCD